MMVAAVALSWSYLPVHRVGVWGDDLIHVAVISTSGAGSVRGLMVPWGSHALRLEACEGLVGAGGDGVRGRPAPRIREGAREESGQSCSHVLLPVLLLLPKTRLRRFGGAARRLLVKGRRCCCWWHLVTVDLDPVGVNRWHVLTRVVLFLPK